MNTSNEKIVIATRSMNRFLYRLSQKTVSLPYKRYRLCDTTADGYILELLKIDADWVINIDEDAFVTNEDSIMSLLQYMKDNSYEVCGFPDGGVMKIRCHNPLIMNPFFNIFHLKSLRNKYTLMVEKNYTAHKSEYEGKTPFGVMKEGYGYEYDFYEPYYPIFLWMNQNAKCLYLSAQEHADGFSTIALDQNDHPFLIHTWWSRAYGTDPFHTERINNAWCEAMGGAKHIPHSSSWSRMLDHIDMVIRKYRANYYKSQIVAFLGKLLHR
jgi:hypothetical protein